MIVLYINKYIFEKKFYVKFFFDCFDYFYLLNDVICIVFICRMCFILYCVIGNKIILILLMLKLKYFCFIYIINLNFWIIIFNNLGKDKMLIICM